MREEDRKWMEYIDAEVRAVCEAKGWGIQTRRKWSVREKPVAESPVDEYEWKLIPEAPGGGLDASENEFIEGTYYLLSFDEPNEKFLLQHDTHHEGVWGLHFEQSTYTEIVRGDWAARYRKMTGAEAAPVPPPAGWLRDHLLDLVGRYGPNRFFLT